MNVTESKSGSLVAICSMNKMVWKEEYEVEKVAFAVTAIILNILSFPVTILANVLAIMAVTADRLAQLVERRTTEREVSGSSPRPDQHSGS